MSINSSARWESLSASEAGLDAASSTSTRLSLSRRIQVIMRRRGFTSKLVVFLLCLCFVTGVLVMGYGSPPPRDDISLPRTGDDPRHHDNQDMAEYHEVNNDRSHEMIEKIDKSLRSQENNEGLHVDNEDAPVPNVPNENIVPDVAINTDRQRSQNSDKPMKLGPPLVSHHNEKQSQIVEAFKHAWKEYKSSAWGMDEVKPITHTSSTWFNLGLTIIDSLDTIWLMGLEEEYNEARNWVEHGLVIAQNRDVNLFEVTIRVLGGLLSVYHLTKDDLFLDKATDLGDRLLNSFSTSSHVPYSDINLFTLKAHAPKWGPDSSVSEVTTLQLEFRDLTQLTGYNKYRRAVDDVMEKVQSQPRDHNLIPQFINAQTGRLRSGTLTLGSRADSYYEYLLKQWVQSGKKEDKFKTWYLESVEGIKQRLLGYSEPGRLPFIGERKGDRFSPKMDHLVCFFPGTLALGAYNGLPSEHLELAKELLYTCWQMYERMPTGLSPEIVYFNQNPGVGGEDIIVKQNDKHNLLRPETVESLFILYRITKDQKYRDWGWQIFQSFQTYTKLSKGGYSSISDVLSTSNPKYRDKMESFFLGETLKYLFLLFSDDESVLPLDKWVFNTEAHPLPIWTATQ